MFIALDGLFSGGVDFVPIDYSFDFSDVRIGDGCPFSSPVRVIGEITNHAGLVEIDADACFSLTAMCDRCCELSTVDYEVPIIHGLVSSLNNEDDDDYILVEDMHLDLEALAREDILLSLPPVHLCKEDCKGLCPECGANLNKTQCGCRKPVDPRLEALMSLMNE